MGCFSAGQVYQFGLICRLSAPVVAVDRKCKAVKRLGAISFFGEFFGKSEPKIPPFTIRTKCVARRLFCSPFWRFCGRPMWRTDSVRPAGPRCAMLCPRGPAPAPLAVRFFFLSFSSMKRSLWWLPCPHPLPLILSMSRWCRPESTGGGIERGDDLRDGHDAVLHHPWVWNVHG